MTKQTHVSEAKKRTVKELAELMKNNKTIMIASVKNLPSSQFQDIKKKLRKKAIVKVAKKNLIDFALEHAGIKELKDLVKYVQENSAIIFSQEDAFELSVFLSSNKSPAKAKPGQETPEDIKIEPGLTELLPGPDISALSGVGLQVKVENGKIAIMKSAILLKKGEIISNEKSSVLAKLGIAPFKIGMEPVAAYASGKVYLDIKINKEEILSSLTEIAGRSLAFAVSIAYVNNQTLPFILGKAVAYENALLKLIKSESNSN